MSTIPSAGRFPSSKQVPDHSIMDYYNKQTYLGNQFSYATTSILGSGSETPVLLLRNPVGNTLSLFQNVKQLTSITTSLSAVFRIYFAPTVTGVGTAQTPVNMRPASATVSTAALTTSPTVSANGTLVEVMAGGAFVTDLSNILSILDPGQSMLVTVQMSSAGSAAIEIGWYEL